MCCEILPTQFCSIWKSIIPSGEIHEQTACAPQPPRVPLLLLLLPLTSPPEGELLGEPSKALGKPV